MFTPVKYFASQNLTGFTLLNNSYKRIKNQRFLFNGVVFLLSQENKKAALLKIRFAKSKNFFVLVTIIFLS